MKRYRITGGHSQTKSTSGGRVGRALPFGPPPLLEGEDAAAYNEFLTRISAAVKPTDILEDIWVRDIVDLVWEVLRLRRLKVNVMRLNTYSGLVTVLEPLLESSDDDDELSAKEIAEDWVRRKPDAIKKVERILASANLTMDAVMAHTLLEHLDPIERIEGLIAMAEARRNAMVREIDRHRSALADALRWTAEDVDAGKHDIVTHKSIERVRPA